VISTARGRDELSSYLSRVKKSSLNPLELRQLRYFVVVAEELSFTRAAERLHIAQSPLSQQILRLERHVGVALFDRTTRSVRLTAAGEVFLERVRASLTATDQAVDSAVKAANGELGRLTLGLTGSATYAFLPGIVRAFQSLAPEVTLDIRTEMFTGGQVEALLGGRMNVGVLRTPVDATGLIVEVLYREPVVALLPKDHPLAGEAAINLAALCDDWFISYPASPLSTLQSQVINACAEAGFVPKTQYSVTDTSAMASLVAEGLGVALVPNTLRSLKFDSITFVPLSTPLVTSELAVAYRAGMRNPLAMRLLKVIHELAPVLRPKEG
jgi:DNA-binding transcriptional LysR family regulator